LNFNESLRRDLATGSSQSQAQALLSQNGIATLNAQAPQTPHYANIFGGHNSYDQVMGQVNSNMQSSMA
jgi:hypothetical protein